MDAKEAFENYLIRQSGWSGYRIPYDPDPGSEFDYEPKTQREFEVFQAGYYSAHYD